MVTISTRSFPEGTGKAGKPAVLLRERIAETRGSPRPGRSAGGHRARGAGPGRPPAVAAAFARTRPAAQPEPRPPRAGRPRRRQAQRIGAEHGCSALNEVLLGAGEPASAI